MIQETHLRKAIDVIASKLAAGSSKARGVAILIRNSVCFDEIACYKDPEGHFAFTKGKLNNEMMTLATIYALNSGQIAFIDTVFFKFNMWGEGPWLLTGDFNYGSDLAIDRPYRHGTHTVLKGSMPTALFQLFEKYNLLDCWRSLHQNERDYTYFSSRFNVHTRLDHCLILKTAASYLQSAEIGVKPFWIIIEWLVNYLLETWTPKNSTGL